ncbi:MFS transporter [Marinobacter sp. JSM 1782161]|uniref:MFS transporter n=1 Tax=Marinobacter sp. JSM 1782161 TaxID=2685906 RepID=UPI0014035D9F|nr:MFS transporter [Marinobacter sp. JSM 1782161]
MALFSQQPGDDGLPGKARLPAMLAVMITTTMNVLDGSMINIALPGIAANLGVSASNAVWVANGYLLAVAMSLAIFSALATRIGFRTQFAGGLIVFTLASAGCALSTSPPMLVCMRVIQGIGGAATLSIAPALLRHIFPNRLLGRVLGINAVLIATCTGVAPVMSGSLLSVLGWPWLFAINLPLGVLAVVLAIRCLPTPERRTAAAFDKSGAVLSAVMLGAMIMCANTFSKQGDAGSASFALLYGLVALTGGWAFVRRQQRAPEPLLPLEIFANRRFSLAAATSMSAFVAQGLTFIALPFLYESVYGYSAFVSALLFTPWPIGIILAAPYAGRLADRVAPALISTLGLAVFAAGLILLAFLPEAAATWDIALRSLVCGLGFGLFQSPNNREIMGNASREYSSYASGVLAIARTFGQSLGAAIIGVTLSLAAHLSDADTPTSHHSLMPVQAVHLGLWFAVAASMLAILLSVGRLRVSLTSQEGA